MQDTPPISDIFIIGGGINGAGIAADATGRGLSVTLCEKGDLAAATSSASSKLIHGGLRYLENYEFRLVRKALQEREILLHKAPHLISPLKFILPHEKHLRPAWLIRLGLFLYDHLASHPLLPHSKKITLSDDILLPSFKMGFSYYDCLTDDARLVVLNAIAAKEKGAVILTNTTCLSAQREADHWKIQLKDNHSGKLFFHYAKALVNASGPWVEAVQKSVIEIHNPFSINLVKGSHIIIPKLYSGDFAYILQQNDKRIVFVIPYESEFTLIGTTDVSVEKIADNLSITPDEEIYLCESINRYFKKNISQKDIIKSYSGIRCLQKDDAETPSGITRDYKIQLTTEPPPLLTVLSGKITTYRRLAEESIEKLRPFFPHMKPAWTATTPLPGGDIPTHNFLDFYQTLQKEYAWLPQKILYRYAKSYGTRVNLILKNTHCIADLGIAFAAGLYQKEVEYLISHEWAKTTEDILWRRTKLGLFFSKEDVVKLNDYLN